MATVVDRRPTGRPTSSGRRPLRQGAPHGRDAVRASLIDAAAWAFADRGPRAVTVRQVADAARVNHGLVHKYFGSKEGLLAAVLSDLAEKAANEVRGRDAVDTLDQPDSPTRRHGRILAYLILDGRNPGQLKSTFPTIDALIDRLQQGGASDERARERAVQLTALVLGWQFFEPFLSMAAGIDSSGAQSRQMLASAVSQLLRPLPDAEA